MKSIGSNIKKKREALGLTQTRLAELSGYKEKSSIAKIESGENDLTIPKLMIFAEVLHCDLEDLLAGLDEEISKSDAFLAIKILLQKAKSIHKVDFDDLPEEVQSQLIAAGVMAVRQYYRSITD